MKGKVKFFNEEKGFGFIEAETGKDVFVHINDLAEYIPQKGDIVTFEIKEGRKGPQAMNIKME